MIRNIFSQSVIYAVAPQIPRFFSILILPILTRYLSPEDYGIAATVLVYSGLLSGVKDLGLTIVMVNSFFHFPKSWVLRWNIIYGYLLMWAPILFVMHWIILYFSTPMEASSNKLIIATLVSLPLLLYEHTILFGFRYYQTVKKNARYIGLISLVAGSSIVASNYLTIVVWKMGYMGWFWSTFIGSTISMLMYVYPVFCKLKLKPVFFLNKDYLLKHLRISLPMIPHNYSAYLLNASDRLVMSTLKVSLKNIGVYNLSYSMGGYAEIAGSSMGLAMGPVINELLAKGDRKAELTLRNLTFLMQTLFIVGLASVALWAKELFYLLIHNPDLRVGYPLAIIIIMAYSYRPMYWTSMTRLSFNKKTNKLWRVSFMGGMMNLLLNFSLIPLFGFTIAAYTSFISILFLGFGAFYLSDFKQLNKLEYNPVKWILAIISVTCLVYFMKDAFYAYKLVVTFTFLALGLFACLKYNLIQSRIRMFNE